METDFWIDKYKLNETGWDLGEISPPLKAYFDQLENKDLQLLIPGSGRSYEAEYLFHKGFTNVFVADVAAQAISDFLDRCPGFPKSHCLIGDFFELNQKFDLIIEQTFFCALPPTMRSNYAQKMSELLLPNGILCGVMFDFPLTEQGPPFGGSKPEYLNYFEEFFFIETMEPCYNSHPSREGKELFVKLIKR